MPLQDDVMILREIDTQKCARLMNDFVRGANAQGFDTGELMVGALILVAGLIADGDSDDHDEAVESVAESLRELLSMSPEDLPTIN